MSEKTEVKHSPAFIEAISELTAVNKTVVIEKNDDDTEVKILGRDADKSTAYVLKAPIDYFNFDQDSICMYNYQEFFSLYSVLENAELELDDSNIIISEDKTEINFRLTDEDDINKGDNFSGVNFSDPDVELEMDSTFITKIKSLISASKIDANFITFMANGDGTLTYRLKHSRLPNTFEQTLDVTDNSEEDFKITVTRESFSKIPTADYTVGLKEEGLIEFKQKREDEISLKLYVADTE